MDNTSTKTPPYDDVRAALIALGETPEPERVLALQAKIGDSLAAPGGRDELITRNPNFFHYVLGADGEPRAAFDVSSEAHAYAKRDSRYEVLHRAELALRFGDRYRGYYAGDAAPVPGMAAGQATQANGDRAAAGTLFDIQFEATGYTAVDLNGRELSEAQAAGYTATARAEGSLPGHVMAVVRGQISEDDAQGPDDRKVFATVTLRMSVEPGADADGFQPPRVLLAYLTDLMAMDAAGEVPLTLAGDWRMTEIEPAGAALSGPARAAQAVTHTPPLAQASVDPQRLLREMRAAFAVIARHTDDVAVKQFALEQFDRLPLSLVDAIAAAVQGGAAQFAALPGRPPASVIAAHATDGAAALSVAGHKVIYLANAMGEKTGYGSLDVTDADLDKVPFDRGPRGVLAYLTEIGGRKYVQGNLELAFADQFWGNDAHHYASEAQVRAYGEAVVAFTRGRLTRGAQVLPLDEGDPGRFVVQVAVPLESVADSDDAWRVLGAIFGTTAHEAELGAFGDLPGLARLPARPDVGSSVSPSL